MLGDFNISLTTNRSHSSNFAEKKEKTQKQKEDSPIVSPGKSDGCFQRERWVKFSPPDREIPNEVKKLRFLERHHLVRDQKLNERCLAMIRESQEGDVKALLSEVVAGCAQGGNSRVASLLLDLYRDRNPDKNDGDEKGLVFKKTMRKFSREGEYVQDEEIVVTKKMGISPRNAQHLINLRNLVSDACLDHFRHNEKNFASNQLIITAMIRSGASSSLLLRFWKRAITREVRVLSVIEVTRNDSFTTGLYVVYHEAMLQDMFLMDIRPSLCPLVHGMLKSHTKRDQTAEISNRILKEFMRYIGRTILPGELTTLYESLGSAINKKRLSESLEEGKDGNDYVISMIFFRFLCRTILAPEKWVSAADIDRLERRDRYDALMTALMRISHQLQKFANREWEETDGISSPESKYRQLKERLFPSGGEED